MTQNFVYKNNVYYKVREKKFNSKFDALLEATRLKDNITFHYYDEVFEKFDKSLLGKQNLNNLYKQRAQQLREEYDYLILYFSGGADSYNILRTFIDNGIKLDEICVKWPMAVVDKQLYNPNTKDKSAFNYLSEWDYAIKPVLDEIKISHPEIKIEIADWSEDFDLKIFNEDNFKKANAWNDVEIGFTLAVSKNEIPLIDTGKKVASIYGIDKPLVALVNGNWLCSFLDTSIGIGTPLDHNSNSVEYFYWTSKMPLLPLEQAYALCTYLDQHPEIKKFFYTESYLTFTLAEKQMAVQIQNDIIKSVIYTTWDSKFQTDKPLRADRTDKQSWIFSHSELKKHKEEFIDMNSLFLSQLDQQFVVQENQGYQVDGKMRGLFNFCKTKWHFVKKETNLLVTPQT
jgi:hypothetical protein